MIFAQLNIKKVNWVHFHFIKTAFTKCATILNFLTKQKLLSQVFLVTLTILLIALSIHIEMSVYFL